MPKRIVVLSDGTGNAASKVWRTNVWRVFELLDLSGDEQVAKYDDGVGSSAFLPLAILGGVFGWGLKRNVIDLYKFVCRNYVKDAQIYAFGFSRGAFTIRVLMALILHQGLVPYTTETELHRRAKDAYRAYRADKYHSVLGIETVFRVLRGLFVRAFNWATGRKPYDQACNTMVPSIEFIGVWDTVAAYGLPVDEMTRGVSQWIWPLELPTRTLHKNVRRACHALALDDERTTFHPVLWTEAGEPQPPADADGKRWVKDERLSQIWFVGMHSNVGGGYPDNSLAYFPLYWIMKEAYGRGLAFKEAPKADPDAFLRAMSARDKEGRLYDSRSGLGGYYRYGPRKIVDLCHMRLSSRAGDQVEIALPKIHESALARMRGDSNAYAPIGLPPAYAVVNDAGRILTGADNPFETPAEAEARVKQQEKVWNLVWMRRVVYFMTLAASFHLAAFWLFHGLDPAREFSSPVRMVSELVRLVESFLPRNVVHWWTDWYAANPVSFLVGIIVLVALLLTGSALGARINDAMRIIWKTKGKQIAVPNSTMHNAIYRLRTNPVYQWTLVNGKRHAVPFLSALVLVWLGATALSHLLFNAADSVGAFCHETPAAGRSTLNAKGAISKQVNFDMSALCLASGVTVESGARYVVWITVTSPWQDLDVMTTPDGTRTAELPSWWQKMAAYSTVPLRRVIFRPWYRMLARIGGRGVDEYFIDPEAQAGKPNLYRGLIGRAERDGELFFYVNEAVISLPGIADMFFRNHRGTATIVVERTS